MKYVVYKKSEEKTKGRCYWERVEAFPSYFDAVIYVHSNLHRKRRVFISLTDIWRTEHLPSRETWDAFTEYPSSLSRHHKNKLKSKVTKIKLDRQLERKYKQSEAKKIVRKNGLEEKGILL